MANIGQREYLRNYKYTVEVGSMAVIGFATVSGLSDESEVIEYREGNMPAFPRKLVGQASSGDVTVERGATDSINTALLMDWRARTKHLMDNTPETMDDVREDIVIKVHGEADDVIVISYQLTDAWPSALEIGDLDAGASEVLIHTLSVVSEETNYAQGDFF